MTTETTAPPCAQIPHPLADVGTQGFPYQASAGCWAGPRIYGCGRSVPLSDALGLCPEHRLEVVGRTPGALPMDGAS